MKIKIRKEWERQRRESRRADRTWSVIRADVWQRKGDAGARMRMYMNSTELGEIRERGRERVKTAGHRRKEPGVVDDGRMRRARVRGRLLPFRGLERAALFDHVKRIATRATMGAIKELADDGIVKRRIAEPGLSGIG